jgi:hypothetical protein
MNGSNHSGVTINEFSELKASITQVRYEIQSLWLAMNKNENCIKDHD